MFLLLICKLLFILTYFALSGYRPLSTTHFILRSDKFDIRLALKPKGKNVKNLIISKLDSIQVKFFTFIALVDPVVALQ